MVLFWFMLLKLWFEVRGGGKRIQAERTEDIICNYSLHQDDGRQLTQNVIFVMRTVCEDLKRQFQCTCLRNFQLPFVVVCLLIRCGVMVGNSSEGKTREIHPLFFCLFYISCFPSPPLPPPPLPLDKYQIWRCWIVIILGVLAALLQWLMTTQGVGKHVALPMSIPMSMLMLCVEGQSDVTAYLMYRFKGHTTRVRRIWSLKRASFFIEQCWVRVG
jgi:hypothetical protein